LELVVRIYLTGEVQVENGAVLLREADLLGRQGRLVFACLVMERERAVDGAELADLLWPEAVPPSAEVALSAIVSKLRSGLACVGLSRGEVITRAFGCYQLRLPPDTWVDVEAAASALHEAEATVMAGKPSEAYGTAVIAVTISKRPFLAGEHGEWVERRRTDLAELRVRALDCLVQAASAWGETELAIKHARQVVRLEPYRESGYVRLMKLLAERGDRAEAIRLYEECRSLLVRELGVEPCREVEELHAELLVR
jgi:DNA-binding SARP family transcriptional activator